MNSNFNSIISSNNEDKRNIFNFLGHKRCIRHDADRQKLSDYNNSTFFSKGRKPLGEISKLNCKFKLKQNKNRMNQNQSEKKIKKSKKVVEQKFSGDNQPRAPHNTSQFLIENFSKARGENYNRNYIDILADTFEVPFSISTQQDETNDRSYENTSDTDDICIVGGTMKGKVNLSLFSEIAGVNGSNNEKESVISTEFSDNSDEEEVSTSSSNSNSGSSHFLELLSKLKETAQENEKTIQSLMELLSGKEEKFT
jgi:hypothetical protein